jgi:hypothetical protein
VVNITQLAGNSTALLNSSITKSAGSRRRALLRWVQIALKPASETLGLHGVFIRGKGLKYAIADSAFKRMQVDARARAGSILTSIIGALHFGQAGRSIAANGMTDATRC